MDEPRQLSRFHITGDVDTNTPVCVLIEMCDSHGVIYDTATSKSPNFAQGLVDALYLYETKPYTITSITRTEDLPYAARYVNSRVSWRRRSKFIEAYNFLIQFSGNDDPLTYIPVDFHCGPQTPEHPTSVNACVLYKTCHYHRLHVTSHTTMEQMAYAVRMLREDSATLLRVVTSFVQGHARRTDLINTLMLSPYVIRDPAPRVLEVPDLSRLPATTVRHDMLTHMSTSLNDIKMVQKKITPTTENGAVGLAAINYSMDLSMAQDPVTEYYNLNSGVRTNYVPADPWMRHWLTVNPSIFDLSVTFNPVFPETYYEPRHLAAMAQYEGFSAAEIASSTSYQLMQFAYVSETFYLGPLPNMTGVTTPFSYVDIEEIPPGELLCYGTREQALHPVSIGELLELFQYNKNFTDPFSQGAIFTSSAITKLRNIILDHSIHMGSDTIRMRTDLLNTITRIEHLNSTTDGATRDLIQVHQRSNSVTRDAIVGALTKLLQAGLYMRGWMGPGHPYPIEHTVVTFNMYPTVDLQVSAGINAYETSIRNLGTVGRQINDLPLVRFRGGQYQKSTTREKGFTIGDRMQLVKQGDTTSNIESCIRLSSNWLCASAHNYLVVLGQPPPFDIFHLRDIA
jgi:hypothetical protein